MICTDLFLFPGIIFHRELHSQPRIPKDYSFRGSMKQVNFIMIVHVHTKVKRKQYSLHVYIFTLYKSYKWLQCCEHSCQPNRIKGQFPSGTWSYLWFSIIHECPQWSTIVRVWAVTVQSVLLYFMSYLCSLCCWWRRSPRWYSNTCYNALVRIFSDYDILHI